MPAVSSQLGKRVRTNSESLIGVRIPGEDLSKGIAIGSGVYIDDHTHIEAVRYPERLGCDEFALHHYDRRPARHVARSAVAQEYAAISIAPSLEDPARLAALGMGAGNRDSALHASARRPH